MIRELRRRWFCRSLLGLGLGTLAVPARAELFYRGSIPTVESIVVHKARRRMLLMGGGHIVNSFHVALGKDPTGPKRRQGDNRTPEGRYVLDWRNPRSKFYRSIHISYPGPEDIAQARRRGVSPGGDIMIHGLPNGMGVIGPTHAKWDWTNGCIAVTNEEMDLIWDSVQDGTPIEILP